MAFSNVIWRTRENVGLILINFGLSAIALAPVLLFYRQSNLLPQAFTLAEMFALVLIILGSILWLAVLITSLSEYTVAGQNPTLKHSLLATVIVSVIFAITAVLYVILGDIILQADLKNLVTGKIGFFLSLMSGLVITFGVIYGYGFLKEYQR